MDRPFNIYLNDDLEWSRGKRAAHAAHAALALHGIRYTHALRVLNAKPRDIELCDLKLPVDDARSGVVVDHPNDAVTVYIVYRKSDSRDTTARIAAQTALYMYRGEVPNLFQITSSSESVIRDMPVVVRDQGRTELAPGTVTAGATWI